MRVFSFALMASSALRIRADGTVKAASHETRGLYGSDVIHKTSTGQDGITPDKVLNINDPSTEEEKAFEMKRLVKSVAWGINALLGPFKEHKLFIALEALKNMHPVLGEDTTAADSPEFKKLISYLVQGNKALRNDLLRTRSDNRWPVTIALLIKSDIPNMRVEGEFLLGSLMAEWHRQGMSINRLLKKLTKPQRSIIGFTDYDSLCHYVVLRFCRFEFKGKGKGDAAYLKAIMELHEGKTGFILGLHYVLKYSADKSRALELLNMMLERYSEAGVAPSDSFQRLMLHKYKGKPYDTELQPLLHKHVFRHKYANKRTQPLLKWS
ncbi:unnamed protein product [Hyaloperonospora brassicae]|uniref:RxLR effector candidate protein n=1 Tax=Hyaloperonospora brassicae TaxID=162125 RepID=A0AAV0U0W0_HYABA|nr:unnamed protein product [Hyaloperonospora brassicae]CAI5728340.1 unnamed protein product [Hyaloperonospora brassicae]